MQDRRPVPGVCAPVVLVALGLACADTTDRSRKPRAEQSTTGPTLTTSSGTSSKSVETETEQVPPFTGCEGDTEGHALLDALWQTFDATYAVFDARLPDEDWGEVGREACARIAGDLTDDDLYDVMLDMLRHLDDGHTNLIAPSLGRSDDAWVSVYPHYETLYRLELNVERELLDAPLAWDANDWFAWGSIGNIGYVSITSMDELSPGGAEGPDRMAANRAMSNVLSDLGDKDGLVVDVRANEGGWDTVALDIATWFSGSRTLAWSEARRDGPEHDAFGPWEDVYVEDAVPGAYSGPVVVLSSGGTFSAAETFLLAMRVRDQVTLMGEPSSGHFSDLIDGKLDNGWRYTLSGERYRAADGNVYEAQGVPVDVAVSLDVAAFETQAEDVMLLAALEELDPT